MERGGVLSLYVPNPCDAVGRASGYGGLFLERRVPFLGVNLSVGCILSPNPTTNLGGK
jgi:hypothetical protein